jgi:Zn-dependent peptidase ImmA (M78 family)
MAFTAKAFGRKLSSLRTDFGQDLASVAISAGIPAERLSVLEHGQGEPTGDEVLILADHFHKDFRLLLADDARDPDEGVELLFRERGNELPPADRIAIAEFAFLCRSEAMLERELGIVRDVHSFSFRPRGSFFKTHGADCATKLRAHLGLSDKDAPRDLFATIRNLGIRVFRRRLENSNISGLFMNHPEAGPCILVNLAEGMARQRFSAARELGHGLLDEKPITLSMVGEWSSNVLVEVRANTFASHFLMPPALLADVAKHRWADPAEVSSWAGRLRVSLSALLSALHAAKLIDGDQRRALQQSAVRPAEPPDPELEGPLTQVQMNRKQELVERGLSKGYVDLCFQAHNQGVISFGLLVELLLATPGEATEIAAVFGRTLAHD